MWVAGSSSRNDYTSTRCLHASNQHPLPNTEAHQSLAGTDTANPSPRATPASR